VIDVFAARSPMKPSSASPLAVLLKRLQESFTRMESFEVVTVSPGGDGTSVSSHT
jgi:E3 ubiquitin-protein ligase TRIP12